MKRFILVAIVAVSMLFAFTACEQQPLDYPIAGDNDIANVAVSNVSTFYAGDDQITGTATVTVTRVGGGTTSGILGIVKIDGSKVSAGVNNATVSFGAKSGESYEYVYPIQVEAASVESLEVKYDEKTTTGVSQATDVDVKSVVGVYADGTKTDSLALGTVVTRALNDARTAVVYTLSADQGYGTEDVTFSVDVTATPVTPATVESLAVTYGDDDSVRQALIAGASGYLLKDVSPTELLLSIRSLGSGMIQISPDVIKKLLQKKYIDADDGKTCGPFDSLAKSLTRREREIFTLIATGYQNDMIARELNLTEQTVRNYVSTIYDKLGVKDRFEIIRLANMV